MFGSGVAALLAEKQFLRWRHAKLCPSSPILVLSGSFRPRFGSGVLGAVRLIHLSTHMGSGVPWDAVCTGGGGSACRGSPACGAQAVPGCVGSVLWPGSMGRLRWPSLWTLGRAWELRRGVWWSRAALLAVVRRRGLLACLKWKGQRPARVLTSPRSSCGGPIRRGRSAAADPRRRGGSVEVRREIPVRGTG